MKLRSLLGGLAASTLSVAAVNRAIAARAGALPPALPGEQHTYRWRGFEVEYTEGGDPSDPDLLLLHGIHAAATSQEFDRVFDRLCEDHHVLAPDLPGFGRSSRPAVTYTSALYEEFVADFAATHTVDATCVATSLTGAYAARVADRAGFSRLVLVAPIADVGPRRSWLRALVRSPVVGEALFNLLVSRPSLRYYDRVEGYADGADETTLDYQWRTAHRAGARYAPASFVGGYLTPGYDLGSVLEDVSAPVTLVWGREATQPPLEEGRALAERADARLVVVGRTRLLPHAERPDAFLEAVESDLRAAAGAEDE
jgi:pimeloyl-ACP methyl ester carboxylesterase